MTPTIVYVYPGPAYLENAMRFVATYQTSPPGAPHNSLVVCNNCKADSLVQVMFSPLANVGFLEHDNSGYDIGAFQMVSRAVGAGLLVFFGSSAYFPRGGWMIRIVESVERRKTGLFGTHGNAGDWRVNVFPHVRTTGFWIDAALFNQYPLRVDEPSKRYQFEHGKECLTSWIKSRGLYTWVVTFDGEFLQHYWDQIPNAFHRGDQSALLVRDRLTDPPFYNDTTRNILPLSVFQGYIPGPSATGGGNRY